MVWNFSLRRGIGIIACVVSILDSCQVVNKFLLWKCSRHWNNNSRYWSRYYSIIWLCPSKSSINVMFRLRLPNVCSNLEYQLHYLRYTIPNRKKTIWRLEVTENRWSIGATQIQTRCFIQLHTTATRHSAQRHIWTACEQNALNQNKRTAQWIVSRSITDYGIPRTACCWQLFLYLLYILPLNMRHV